MFVGLRVSLIDNWAHAWRWSSMRALAVGGVTQTALMAAPQRLLDYAPGWMLQGLSVFSLGCILAAGIGRVTVVEKPACPLSPPPSQ